MSKLELRPPSAFKQFLESTKLREICPADLCADRAMLDLLLSTYTDLQGDSTAIGRADFEGECQGWRNDSGWWRELVAKHGSES